jgi:hypothetical protein
VILLLEIESFIRCHWKSLFSFFNYFLYLFLSLFELFFLFRQIALSDSKSALRTNRIYFKPSFNTVWMKCMALAWQHYNFAFILEFIQANSTHKFFFVLIFIVWFDLIQCILFKQRLIQIGSILLLLRFNLKVFLISFEVF